MAEQRLLELLRGIKFPEQPNRKNIQRGDDVPRGFVLGIVRHRGHGLKYDKRMYRESERSGQPKYQHVYAAAKALIREHDPAFEYTTIQVNKNTRTAKHVDAYNVGVSKMIGLGDYLGGDLLIYDEDGRSPTAFPTRGQWITFDGSAHPHETAEFEGERYTLVYFSIRAPPPRDTREPHRRKRRWVAGADGGGE